VHEQVGLYSYGFFGAPRRGDFGAWQGEADRNSGAYTPAHEHFEVSFNADKRQNIQPGVPKMIDGFIALYIFMLAAFTGYEVIARVPVILHTPLMSGSNFVHGIVLVGAMVVLGQADGVLEQTIGFIGVFLAAGNAVGGYVVTERMLEMFRTSGTKTKNKAEPAP